MSTVNVGSQRIGWKFSTPLQADYLNTFISGLSTEGLLNRPRITVQRTTSGADVYISPFTMLIIPNDRKTEEKLGLSMVKLSTTETITLSITSSAIAIGVKYTFQVPGQGGSAPYNSPSWYADINVINQQDMDESNPDKFDGLFIATIQQLPEYQPGIREYSVTTNGADISDALLIKEGWNPNCWLSVVSPRRSQFGPNDVWGIYNRLEVRTHNEEYSQYMNGHEGLVKLESLNWQVPASGTLDPYGITGQMPAKYCSFKLQTDGFNIAETSNTITDNKVAVKTSGGIFALVDASNTINQNTGATNGLDIYPVQKENINIYFDDPTLMIR